MLEVQLRTIVSIDPSNAHPPKWPRRRLGMAGKIADVRIALQALVDNLELDDETFLVTVADAPELSLPFTSEGVRDPKCASPRPCPQRSTALFDAVRLAITQMHKAANRGWRPSRPGRLSTRGRADPPCAVRCTGRRASRRSRRLPEARAACAHRMRYRNKASWALPGRNRRAGPLAFGSRS